VYQGSFVQLAVVSHAGGHSSKAVGTEADEALSVCAVGGIEQGLISTGALVRTAFIYSKQCCISVSFRWLISNSGNPYSLEHPLKFVVKAVEPKKSSRTISWL